MSVFIVAEAGVNHLGDRAKMLALCDAAKAAGADAVKFQAYDTVALAKRRGLLPNEDADPNELIVKLRQTGCTGAHTAALRTIELLAQAELSDADLDAIAAHCKSIGLKWFASVFDPSQIERVLSRGACCLKVGHAETSYAKLMAMCTRRANESPDFMDCYASYPPDFEPGDGPTNITPILCTTEYPAKSPPQLWKVIGGSDQCWGDESSGFAGFSSHYTDYRIPAAAAMRGAEYIEAHLKLSDTDPEAAWSLSVEDFGSMVKLIREYESWL
jgi:N,N'-diacetyllegionaminate synthase